MITRVEIPKLTLTMDEATLVKWLKREGESVEKDEPLFELETDKTVVEVPSPFRGIVKKILIHEGTVSVGASVALIGEAGDLVVATAEHEGGEIIETIVSPQSTLLPSTEKSTSTRATPAARRRAKELGLNLGDLLKTATGGRITEEDVERMAPHSAVPLPLPIGYQRRLIGERTSNTWRTVPHIHIGGELVATGLRVALERERKVLGQTLSITDLLLFVTASVLGGFVPLNSVWRDNQLEGQTHIHLAFAVETEWGVVTPTIHDADRLSLVGLSAKRKDLTDRALARRLEAQELSGGTFTVTNLGMYPVDFFVPVINHPQSAILATGRVRQGVSVKGIRVKPEWHMWANIAVDHRAADGATAAKFLQKLEQAIEALQA